MDKKLQPYYKSVVDHFILQFVSLSSQNSERYMYMFMFTYKKKEKKKKKKKMTLCRSLILPSYMTCFFILPFGLKIYGWNKQHSFNRAWGCLFIRETMLEGWRPGTKWPKWPHSTHSFNKSLENLVKSYCGEIGK